MREQIERYGNERAVSPVIGVILMVAITVILAAVIGAFVLEIGDQQETAPSTSFDSGQAEKFYQDNSDKINVTEVEITHAGGSNLDVSNNRIKVNGDASWWGVASTSLSSGGLLPAEIQPDTSRTAGSNEAVQFTSGQSWTIIAGNNDAAPSHDDYDTTVAYHFDIDGSDKDVFLEEGGSETEDEDSENSDWGAMSQLENGDNVNVVWTASSGGKTQTLFKYSVQ